MSAFACAESAFRTYLAKEHMDAYLSGGALIALSGGKDSVLLFTFFASYAKEKGIPFAAYHLNHGIRGAEADRDEAFCVELCKRMGVPLTVERIDIPALAKKSGEGVEQTARKVRYHNLSRVCQTHGFSAVLTAHTASDLAETVLLYLLRGGGTRALGGIPPVRALDGVTVLRPLLTLTSEQITSALKEKAIAYVTDSTNSDVSYHRNYVRKELLPRMRAVTPAPERAILRLSENMREDEAYLSSIAKDAYDRLFDGEGMPSAELLLLPSAIRYRTFRLFYDARFPEAPRPERVHMDALFARMEKPGDFSMPFPGEISARVERGRVLLFRGKAFDHGYTPVHIGYNRLADGSILWLLEKTSDPLPENIYTLSTQHTLSFATIEGELYVRSKKEGDAYVYGGITHKLKKLFSDRKIPVSARAHIPVLCDGRGILWVPSFGARDDGVKQKEPLTVLYLPKESGAEEI